MQSVHVEIPPALLDHPDPSTLDWLSRTQPDLFTAATELAGAYSRRAPTLHAEQIAMRMMSLFRSGSPERRLFTALPKRAMVDVTAYMHAHMHRNLTLGEVAAVAHLSPYHFVRQFQMATGTSPMRMLTLMRMHHARRMLANGTYSVLTVAQLSGYASPSAFSTAFRRTFGLTPSSVAQEAKQQSREDPAAARTEH